LLRSGSVSNYSLQYFIFSAAGYLGLHFSMLPYLLASIASLAILSLNSYMSLAEALLFLSANFFIIKIFLEEEDL